MTSMFDAFADHSLNEKAQPLGYAVLFNKVGTLGADDFATRYVVRPFGHQHWSGHDRWFDTPEQVDEYLDVVAKYPKWTLNLDDQSATVTTDAGGMHVVLTDNATGEKVDLGGWAGVCGTRSDEGISLSRVTINSTEPPTVGRWRRAEF